jgi:hypothetical protein
MSLAAPELDYLVNSFHPGYMDSPLPERLPKGATPDAKNCLFIDLQLEPSPQCSLAKRTGSRLLTPSQVVAGSGFDGLYEFRQVGSTVGQLVAVIFGAVYVWDGISAFTKIGATNPFQVGTKVTFYVGRNVLHIMDGVTTRCWDGNILNDLFTPGGVAPTGAGVLTDGGVSAGSGIPNGTYEGVYTWYDSAHDHETSPSAATGQVVLTAGHKRTWTKPAGAPAANFDKWRVYCRRVDTNETYYKSVGEVAIATASVDDTFSDGARNLRTLAPLPLTNDPQPLTFTAAMEYQGYRIAVVANDDQLYVSKINDPQSQYFSDILGVGRGTGSNIRSVKKFGTEAVIQKATKTYRLKGDRMPFVPEELHGNFGNVGSNSAVEVKGRYFAWDQDKGPYWTDLATNWVPIGTDRIKNIIDAVPKTYAVDIDCILASTMNLVIWSVPTNAIGRRRTLIAYHTELNAWLPPITGLEYATISTYLDSTGTTNLYCGDYWGRLLQLFTDNVEGVPSGSLIARVSASTAGTVTCDFEQTIAATGIVTTTATAVAFYTTGDALRGLPVLHIASNGTRQWRRIQSNIGATITLDTTNDSAWASNPVAGDTIVVGGIDWYWRAPLITFGDRRRKKTGRYLTVGAKPASSSFACRVLGLLEGFTNQTFQKYFAGFTLSNAWGVGLWGTMLWGGSDPTGLKTRIGRTFFGFSFELSNPFPNQPVSLVETSVSADPVGKKWVNSGG